MSTKACSFVGCVHRAEKRGLCGAHMTQIRRGQSLRPLRTLLTAQRHETRDGYVAVFLYDKHGNKVGESLVDTDVSSCILGVKWCKSRCGYAVATVKCRQYKLHRMIVNAPAGLFVDHINGDTLDNRRSNLRIVNRAQNAQNTVHSGRKRLRNVYFEMLGCTGKPKLRPYCVRVQAGGRRVTVGFYQTEDEAVEAARKARSEMLPFASEARHLD